jgi:hypothetical protein
MPSGVDLRSRFGVHVCGPGYTAASTQHRIHELSAMKWGRTARAAMLWVQATKLSQSQSLHINNL